MIDADPIGRDKLRMIAAMTEESMIDNHRESRASDHLRHCFSDTFREFLAQFDVAAARSCGLKPR
jgi:hypothetical protein